MSSDTITHGAPAKINLFLAITGRRNDGFHDLVSVAAPITLEDSLELTPAREDELTCDMKGVPTGPENLVWKAIRLWRQATGWNQPLRIVLHKRIPHGAGLGGGSSDATTAILALQRMVPEPLGMTALREIAAKVGSDCNIFLEAVPTTMHGRGEITRPLGAKAASAISGRRILLFKPPFGIDTAWAYGRLAANPANYVLQSWADERLDAFQSGAIPIEDLLFNNMQPPVFDKYPALPLLLNDLKERYGLHCLMSGSGSSCFALLPHGHDCTAAMRHIRECWGPDAFIHHVELR